MTLETKIQIPNVKQSQVKTKKKKQNKPFTDFLDKKRFSVKTRCADTKNTVYNINTFHVTNLQYHILLSTKQ